MIAYGQTRYLGSFKLSPSSFVSSCLRVKQSTFQRDGSWAFISHEDTKTQRSEVKIGVFS